MHQNHVSNPPHPQSYSLEPAYLSMVNCCAHHSRTTGLVTSR